MKRAVLMSMKLEWWEKILSGEKTLDIRKTVPDEENGKRFTWPLTVVVYVSGTGEVRPGHWTAGQASDGAIRQYRQSSAGQ